MTYGRGDVFRPIMQLLGRHSGSDLLIAVFTRGFLGSDLVIRLVLNISGCSYHVCIRRCAYERAISWLCKSMPAAQPTAWAAGSRGNTASPPWLSLSRQSLTIRQRERVRERSGNEAARKHPCMHRDIIVTSCRVTIRIAFKIRKHPCIEIPL